MNKGIFIRLLFCVMTMVIFLYAYISKQNTITDLRLKIPQASKDLTQIQQEIIRLQFEVDQFENPANLMELARKPEWRHLKHPLLNEIITIKKE